MWVNKLENNESKMKVVKNDFSKSTNTYKYSELKYNCTETVKVLNKEFQTQKEINIVHTLFKYSHNFDTDTVNISIFF